MQKIVLIVLIGIFAFAAKPKSTQSITTKAKSNACGALIFFNNTSGAAVYKIVVDYTNPTSTDQTFFYPTFPFNTGTRCCGGGVTIIVYFTSGSGIITAVDDANNALGCETFQAPYLSPLGFPTYCGDYYVNITGDSECP